MNRVVTETFRLILFHTQDYLANLGNGPGFRARPRLAAFSRSCLVILKELISPSSLTYFCYTPAFSEKIPVVGFLGVLSTMPRQNPARHLSCPSEATDTSDTGATPMEVECAQISSEPIL